MVFLSLVICALCGLTAAMPYREFETSLPIWFALAPVFWFVARAKTRRNAVLHAAVFALVWTSRSFTFMWNCAFEGAIALSIYTSCIYVVALLCVRKLSRQGLGAAVFGVGALWAIVEILRSTVPILYFPWLLLGHPLIYNAPLRQCADLLGVYGLSFMVASFNALLAFALPSVLPAHFRAAPDASVKRAWRCASIFLALLCGLYFYGVERIRGIAPLLKPGATIAVVQGNIKTKLGRTAEMMDAQFIRHIELQRKIVAEITAKEGAPPALVCWAETMVPRAINVSDMGKVFRDEVARIGIPALAGSEWVEPADLELAPAEQRIHNTAYLFDAKGVEIMHYFKRRLVALGEYVPYSREYPVLKILRSVARSRYVPGTEPSGIAEVGGYRIALNLCVEDIHPCIAREAAWAGADTLINVTNDGWFYGTYGPRAHMMAAAWRAIETRRPMLRVTNTGRTVAVDPLGEITLVVPFEEEAVGGVKLQRIDGGGSAIVTPYMRLGEWWTAAIFGCVLLLSLQFKPENREISSPFADVSGTNQTIPARDTFVSKRRGARRDKS